MASKRSVSHITLGKKPGEMKIMVPKNWEKSKAKNLSFANELKRTREKLLDLADEIQKALE